MLPFQVTWPLAVSTPTASVTLSPFLDGCPETAGTHLVGLQTEQSAPEEFEDDGCWSQRLSMHARNHVPYIWDIYKDEMK